MYMETSGTDLGQTARLVTPELTEGGPFCLTFYYHLYGIHIGELQIEELMGSISEFPLRTNVVASFSLEDTAGI